MAPTMAYHVHETGYHAPWLAKVMNGVNPRLGGLPPHVVLECFLYQLRAFANAGFTGVVAVSGHHGGNQADLRRVAREFALDVLMASFVCSDPELVQGRYAGDHAGRYEISQLLHIRPDLVRMDRADRMNSQAHGGRFAQNSDAIEATAEEGHDIIEASLTELGRQVALVRDAAPRWPGPFLPMQAMEPIWDRIVAEREKWVTLKS